MTHRQRGVVTSPYDPKPAKCYPSKALLECNVCQRRRFSRPLKPELREQVIIDASAIAQKGVCGMWIGVPVVRSYVELEAA